jgi:hypothetical protein
MLAPRVKKFPSFYRTHKFIIVFTKSRHYSRPITKYIHSTPSYGVSLKQVLIASSHVRRIFPHGLSLQGVQINSGLLISLCILHDLFILCALWCQFLLCLSTQFNSRHFIACYLRDVTLMVEALNSRSNPQKYPRRANSNIYQNRHQSLQEYTPTPLVTWYCPAKKCIAVSHYSSRRSAPQAERPIWSRAI